MVTFYHTEAIDEISRKLVGIKEFFDAIDKAVALLFRIISGILDLIFGIFEPSLGCTRCLLGTTRKLVSRTADCIAVFFLHVAF
jgi:hypothetical protein